MKSTSETGHAKNVANFQQLIEFVTAYGSTYNPSKKSLQLPQLITLKTEAENTLSDVLAKNTIYNNKVNERVEAFAGLRAQRGWRSGGIDFSADARAEWQRLRIEANNAKAVAKQTRANLVVRLRVFGNDGTGGIPIKTSAERLEWADADPEVQQAELNADLAQTVRLFFQVFR